MTVLYASFLMSEKVPSVRHQRLNLRMLSTLIHLFNWKNILPSRRIKPVVAAMITANEALYIYAATNPYSLYSVMSLCLSVPKTSIHHLGFKNTLSCSVSTDQKLPPKCPKNRKQIHSCPSVLL